MFDFQKFIEAEGTCVSKEKAEHVFMQGDAGRSLYLVQSGLLKAYYTSGDGKEFIKSFIMSDDVICSLQSIYGNEGCSFSLLCLEPTKLIKIPFAVLQEYSRSNNEISTYLIDLLLNLSMKKEQREYELLCLSAEERFINLVKSNPALINKVTQNDIAHYLGVTPVGLSRIKSRVKQVISNVERT